ncbi:MAG: HlyD family type I secretion periplasmic adaptor subunit [Alphaproteobacteria bacterium]|jgi:adhesin transport system membrane fusion protein|nr:HlyD family type I secretion periplasmic adaptor subunit [Alphaproteobacteria bacterium]
MSHPPEHDLDYLPPRAAAFLRVGHKKSYLAQKIIFLFFIFFLVWANMAELHEVTKGTGKIISSSHLQTINNLEGGIVKEILVRDDQVVAQGQVLVRLDTTISQAKYTQDLENYLRFLATTERLRAQISGQVAFIPSQELQTNAPGLVMQEQERFRSNREKKANDIKIAEKDYQIKKQELAETKSKLTDSQQQYKLVSEQIRLTKPLAEKKIYSKVDFIKLQRDQVEQGAQLKLMKVTSKRQTVAMNQAKDRLDQVRIRYHTEDLQELRDVEGRLAEARGAQTTDRDRVVRSEIRSPITGTIRDIKVRTVGAVIQPGEAILDIVPLNDTLLVEAQIPPSDIGFLHEGMPATIKVTAFDFSTWGGLEAIISEISADTITDKREQSYYRVYLRTNSNVLSKNGKYQTILPGMQVEADILTGKKTIMEYFMKPFTRALQNAMTER